jgi:precorrin-6A/cobalt-precorrin-6A reductase
VTGRTTVLILGGTTEARALADLLAGDPSLLVVTSYAGRTSDPRRPRGQTRSGPFGGPDGLRTWLADNAPAVLVDATHPYAEQVSAHAAAVDAPRLRLTRPGWTAQAGDRWHRVADLGAAADALPTLGRRALLTTGRQRLAPFTEHHGCAALPLLLVRCVDPPAGPLPPNVVVRTERGPFTLVGETALLRRHAIDVLVTKDSGGDATRPKLDAARAMGVPVIMVDRPAPPDGPATFVVADAARWVRERAADRASAPGLSDGGHRRGGRAAHVAFHQRAEAQTQRRPHDELSAQRREPEVPQHDR